jgi:membrane-associated phospholipid phosphatase
VLLRTFAVVMPIAMGLAVVVTGNHFILDVVAGTAVALFGLWAAVMLDRHGDRAWNLVVPLSHRRAQA